MLSTLLLPIWDLYHFPSGAGTLIGELSSGFRSILKGFEVQTRLEPHIQRVQNPSLGSESLQVDSLIFNQDVC